MKRIRRIWAERTAAERLLAAVVAVAVAATCVIAAVALVKRPADISDPDADFRAGNLSREVTPEREEDRTVDWPRYGYDEARTKFLNVPRVRPPFRKRWKYDQDQLIEFAPIIAGERMFLIDNDGVFITLENDTGKVVWRKQLGELNASSPAFWRGMLLAVNLEPHQAIGVRARDGKVMWTRDLPSRAESSPLVHGKRMYFGTESGDFFALDARTGKVIWQTKLDGEVKAAPAFVGGTLYVGDYAGQFYALQAKDGAIRWQTSDLGAGLGRSGRFYSTPAVAFGRVYVGNVDGRVYSFDGRTGEIAWTHSAGDYVYSGIAAADGPRTKPAVYFGSHDRKVYSLDARSGDVNWTASPGGMVSGPATVIGDIVYVSTFSGNATVGFRLKTGRRVFKFDEGEYGPVVSDGERLYMVGGSEVIAFDPVSVNGDYETKKGQKGIIPPAELRRLRKRERQRGDGQPTAATDGDERPAAGARGGGERKVARAQRRARLAEARRRARAERKRKAARRANRDGGGTPSARDRRAKRRAR